MDTIVAILSNPAILNLVAFGAMSLWAYIAKKNANADRWNAIVDTAAEIVVDLISKGWGDKTWSDIAAMAMKILTEEVQTNPAIKTLSESEVEKIKPYVMAFSQRKNGLLNRPTAAKLSLPIPVPSSEPVK